MTVPADTAGILSGLLAHYRKPGEERSGEILITEPQAPGSQRRCDLLRVGMWLSRGMGIDVHEIKISRSDWQRELDDPAKAEAWWPYCSRFWITAPPGIVAPGELPEGWGLMEPQPRGRRFKVRVPAASKAPKLTVGLLIELMRRADNTRLAEIHALRSHHSNEMWKIQHERQVRQAEAAIPYEVKQRLDLLERVEGALGIPLRPHPGWPQIPADDVTPAELAALFADARDHVTALRRGAEAERIRAHLQQAAKGVLQQVERISPQQPAPDGGGEAS
jgi:hypothetical protein